ncbi:hypothetical protein SAMD00079811_76690 (plasmid) [Scytonema sp. HK-05]|nr:hypothetical protein SAMD00079811_76690 [Scytonema sp. HK-05]
MCKSLVIKSVPAAVPSVRRMVGNLNPPLRRSQSPLPVRLRLIIAPAWARPLKALGGLQFS